MEKLPKITKEEFLELFGRDPEEVYKSMREFQKSARKLSAQMGKLTEQYPEQWIGFVKGRVEANGPTHTEVLRQIDAKGIDRDGVILRFLTRNPAPRL